MDLSRLPPKADTRPLIRRANLAEILCLRHAVLRPGRPADTANFAGDDDPRTRHYGAFPAEDHRAGDCLACLSTMRADHEGQPAWQLRGMAVRGDLQGRGLGAALLRFALDDLRPSAGPRLAWCNARLEAVGFYEKLGWRIVSDRFEVPDVGPHHRMVLALGPLAPEPAR